MSDRLRLVHVVPGAPPISNHRANVFIHRQVNSLRAFPLDLQIVYAGLGSKPSDMLSLYRKLRGVTTLFRPHIIHSQYATMTGWVTLAASSHIPTIVSFGGDEVYGTYINERSTGSLRTSLARRFSISCARRADAVVVKNAEMQQIVRGWGATWIEDIPNGIDLNLFSPLEQETCRDAIGLDRQRKYVAFAVRDGDFVKREDLALNAISYLQQQGERVELLRLADVPADRVAIYLNAADVLLLVSNHEGSPNIVKEALACNRPVVATDVGDIRQRFEAVRGLFLIRPDVSEIGSALQSAMSLRNSNGRVFVTSWSQETVAQRLFDLYRAVLSC